MSEPAHPVSDLTSATLLLRLKATDEEPRQIAWQEFHARYAPIITSFAKRFGLRPNDVDEVVQDVLVGFYAAVPEFVYSPAKGRFRGYLKACVHNVIRRRLAAKARLRAVPLADLDPSAPEVQTEWDAAWERQRLSRALGDLRSHYESTGRAKTFAAFEQYVLLGLQAEDAAAKVGVSVDSVYQAKHRITAALHARLSELAAEDE